MSSPALKYKELLESVTCNLCGADDYQVIYPPCYEHARPDKLDDVFRSSGDEILVDQLVRCRHCGLQYLNPRLKSDVVINAYRQGQDEVFVSQAVAREHSFLKGIQLITRLHPSKGTILDVGTAGGSFLAVAKRHGWDVAGCEPNAWLAQWSHTHYGIRVHAGTLSDMNIPDHSFDVVTLWDVLEHTPDPLAVLRECRRILKPDGLLLVNYPDSDSLPARVMGRRWVFLLSVHLYYFTGRSMKKMLSQAGFRVLHGQRHWQTLELDYILFRMKAYQPALAAFGQKVVEKLGLKKALVPYWMGQRVTCAHPVNQ